MLASFFRLAVDYETLFEDSYSRVIGDGVGISERGQAFFVQFYGNFFGKSPDITRKFIHTDMNAQVGVLQKSMYHMISFYVTKKDTEYLSHIAETHSRRHFDVKPEYYDIWLDSLLETVMVMDPEYERHHALAWRLAMMPGIEFMKFHY